MLSCGVEIICSFDFGNVKSVFAGRFLFGVTGFATEPFPIENAVSRFDKY